MSVGCLFSSTRHPCTPCVQRFVRLGSRRSSSSTCRPNPSCDGVRSPVRCGMVKAGRLGGWGGTQTLEVGSSCFAILFGGDLGRTPVATVTSATAWLAIQDSGGLPGGEPKAHLFVAVQHQRGDKGLFQAFSTAVAGVVVCNYYVVQV